MFVSALYHQHLLLFVFNIGRHCLGGNCVYSIKYIVLNYGFQTQIPSKLCLTYSVLNYGEVVFDHKPDIDQIVSL